MNIIFFGTPLFAADVLKHLLLQGVHCLAIVTKPDDDIRGKIAPSAVKKVAEEHSLPLYQPVKASSLEMESILAAYSADLFVVVAYGEILTEKILALAPRGAINVHASLLPRYRGASPIESALLNGDKESGITLMQMVKRMDAGPILAQSTVEIAPSMNRRDLEDALIESAKGALSDLLLAYDRGESIVGIPQCEEEATYVHKLSSESRHISWEGSSEDIHNQLRAFAPHPGAWCQISIASRVKRLKC
ncbi:MAG: methionyl-tRNA formyltransferase, partial [Chlamydiota bacterium]|nr:methionyl-tRNA formyltransferase [Chlamydiota bacterium]